MFICCESCRVKEKWRPGSPGSGYRILPSSGREVQCEHCGECTDSLHHLYDAKPDWDTPEFWAKREAQKKRDEEWYDIMDWSWSASGPGVLTSKLKPKLPNSAPAKRFPYIKNTQGPFIILEENPQPHLDPERADRQEGGEILDPKKPDSQS